MRCEDYPACGHGTNRFGQPDCPTAEGRWTCVRCGELLPKSATSSICHPCLKKMQRPDPVTGHSELDDPHGDYENPYEG